MSPRSEGDGGRDLVGSRVRVELADGFNFVGTVRRDGVEGVDRRLLIVDSRGNDRVVRPSRPSVSVECLDVDGSPGSAVDGDRAIDLDDVDGGGRA